MAIPTEFGFYSKSQCIETLETVAPKFYEMELESCRESIHEYGVDSEFAFMSDAELENHSIKWTCAQLVDSWVPEIEEFWHGNFSTFAGIVREILYDYLDRK